MTERINEGTIFPITDNGQEKMYVTDAPYKVIADCFIEAEYLYDYITLIKEKGYRINRYRPSISLSFDDK
ncbi:hypothetical protein ACW5UC_25400 [Priestia aryabhattai]|jgi:hypothetical protein|uniref:hypothetical protein n=1 Tax=Priestia megaterium TaxID=1404 RepID=UPI003F9E9175